MNVVLEQRLLDLPVCHHTRYAQEHRFRAGQVGELLGVLRRKVLLRGGPEVSDHLDDELRVGIVVHL